VKSEILIPKSPRSEAELLRRTGETNSKYKIQMLKAKPHVKRVVKYKPRAEMTAWAKAHPTRFLVIS